MDDEPPEIKWLLDHANERGPVWDARRAELEDALRVVFYVQNNRKNTHEVFTNLAPSVGPSFADSELAAYQKIRDAKEAARVAEEREAARRCEGQRRAFPPMGAPPAPHPGGRPPTARARVIKEMHATPAEELNTMKGRDGQPI